jgi:hypothetical protein
MADYTTVKSYLEEKNLHYFTLSPKSEEPVKAVHLVSEVGLD